MTTTEVLDGRYLNSEDSDFLRYVTADIECFLRDYETEKRKVLLFPPVNNYHRFLIHRAVEEGFPFLTTFSIGEGDDRRTVVCSQELIYSHIMMERSGGSISCLPPSTNRLSASRPGCGGSSRPTCREAVTANVAANTRKAVRPLDIYRPPAARRKDEVCAKEDPPVLSQSPGILSDDIQDQKLKERSRRRRPDIQVYVPRAKREASRPSSPHASSPVRKCVQAEETKKEMKSEPRSRKVSVECDSDGLGIEVKRQDKEKDLIMCRNKCLGSETDISEPKKKLLRHRKRSAEVRVVASEVESVQIEFAEEKHKILPTKKSGCDRVEKMCVDAIVSNGSGDSVVNCDKVSDVSKHSESQSAIEIVSKVIVPSSPSELEKNDSVEVVDVEENGEIKNIVLDVSCKLVSECGEESENIVSDILGCEQLNELTTISEPTESSLIRETVTSADPSETTKLGIITNISPATETVPSIVLPEVKDIEPSDVPKSAKETAPSSDPDDDSSWDSLYDDNGDCLKPSLLEELTFSVGKVSIQKPQTDYHEYINKDPTILDDEFGHVVEIYNFPREFKTEDLIVIFTPFKNGGFDIKWVDDTHALGVFSSATVAADVLAYQHPFVKTRPLHCATRESKVKARRTSEFLQPYKQRPATSMALARRLVLGSLGVRVVQSREQREAERKQLQEAREQKRLAARQREAAWEGTLGQM